MSFKSNDRGIKSNYKWIPNDEGHFFFYNGPYIPAIENCNYFYPIIYFTYLKWNFHLF